MSDRETETNIVRKGERETETNRNIVREGERERMSE